MLISGCTSPAKAHIVKGDNYYSQKQWADAISEYTNAISLDAGNIAAYLSRGRTYNRMADYNNANADFNKAIELDPRNAKSYCCRADSYYSQGAYDKVIADATKAIDLDPIDTADYVPHYYRGAAYLIKGQLDNAMIDLTKVVELGLKHAEAYSKRGIIYSKQGDYDKAISDYLNAITIDPICAEAFSNLGVAYHMKGDYSKAVINYTNAIEINATISELYYNRGLAYMHIGEYGKAGDDFKKARELDLPQTIDENLQFRNINNWEISGMASYFMTSPPALMFEAFNPPVCRKVYVRLYTLSRFSPGYLHVTPKISTISSENNYGCGDNPYMYNLALYDVDGVMLDLNEYMEKAILWGQSNDEYGISKLNLFLSRANFIGGAPHFTWGYELDSFKFQVGNTKNLLLISTGSDLKSHQLIVKYVTE